ncbi:MAG: class I SAM-dependent methyltransferase [Mycobacteriaceae bacterium]
MSHHNSNEALTPLQLAHSLLDSQRVSGNTTSAQGYLDLLDGAESPASSLAQRAMQNPALALIYERLWRPIFTRGFSFGGPGTANHHRALMKKLAQPGERKILDVACGPGNYTRYFAKNLSGNGVAIGLDISSAMLRQAVRDSGTESAAYIRTDAHNLPFPDNSFDTVVCLAALYLIPHPHGVLGEMARVVRPGGEIAVFTTVQTALSSIPFVRPLGKAIGGFHIFSTTEITSTLVSAGLVDIDQTITGQAQFVTARKPALPH